MRPIHFDTNEPRFRNQFIKRKAARVGKLNLEEAVHVFVALLARVQCMEQACTSTMESSPTTLECTSQSYLDQS